MTSTSTPPDTAAATQAVRDALPDGYTLTLLGVAGSHGYGMAHEHSDLDLRGVHLAPTRDLFRLGKLHDTLTTPPDGTTHELGKFVRLALAANPTVLEVLFLDTYTVCTTTGQTLLDARDAMLSARVRRSFHGYATSQLAQLERRGDGDPRQAKTARQCLRYLDAGLELLTTGTMTVRVADPERLLGRSGATLGEVVRDVTRSLERLEQAESVLPPDPDFERADELLVMVRTQMLTGTP